MSLYDTLRASVVKMMPGFATGIITLKRINAGAISAPEVAWTPPTTTYDVYTLHASAFGVSQEYVDGELVTADDLMIVTSPVALLNGSKVSIEPKISDELLVDGVLHRINKIERIPAAGTAVLFMVFVKS